MTVLHLDFGSAAAITVAVSELSDGEILRLFSLHVICVTSGKANAVSMILQEIEKGNCPFN